MIVTDPDEIAALRAEDMRADVDMDRMLEAEEEELAAWKSFFPDDDDEND